RYLESQPELQRRYKAATAAEGQTAADRLRSRCHHASSHRAVSRRAHSRSSSSIFPNSTGQKKREIGGISLRRSAIFSAPWKVNGIVTGVGPEMKKMKFD